MRVCQSRRVQSVYASLLDSLNSVRLSQSDSARVLVLANLLKSRQVCSSRQVFSRHINQSRKVYQSRKVDQSWRVWRISVSMSHSVSTMSCGCCLADVSKHSSILAPRPAYHMYCGSNLFTRVVPWMSTESYLQRGDCQVAIDTKTKGGCSYGNLVGKWSLLRTFQKNWPKMVLIWSLFWAKVLISENQ